MAKNLLRKLNLRGLTNKAVQPQAVVGAPQSFDPFALLPGGLWTGTGFNVVELPNKNMMTPTPTGDKFRVIVNKTSESFQFTPIGGDILNRGNSQPDISFQGLHYIQKVDDVALPKDKAGIHFETGLFLNIPATTSPQGKQTVARLGTVPHGDSFLSQSEFMLQVSGGPRIDDVDTTPFTLDQGGNRVNDSNDTYLKIIKNIPLPPGIPAGSIQNPNLVLKEAIKGQNIIQTIVFRFDAAPVGGINGSPIVAPGSPNQVGGIVNIPFVNVNANANAVSSIFWIETVQNSDGTTFFQLQYTQTVILDFPVIGPDGRTPISIKWPHISVATLRFTPDK